MSAQHVAAGMAEAARRTGALLNLQLNLTTRCNLSCLHCYRSSERQPSGTEPVTGTELPTDAVVEVFRQAADLGALFLTLSGGEPLLRPDLDVLLRAARELRFAVSVLTNGTLIDPEVADLLAGSHPFRINISLYGGSADVHDRVTRVEGSFEKTLAGIRLLVERGIRVVVPMTIMAPNAEQVEEMMGLARRLGAEPQVVFALTVGMDGDPAPTGLRATDEQIERLMRVPEVARTLAGSQDPACPEERPAADTVMCGAGVTTVTVNADGTVWPCVTLPLPAGDIGRQSLGEIWRSSEVLAKLRQVTSADLAECSACEVRALCWRCPADALLEGGALTGVSPEACRVARIAGRVADGGNEAGAEKRSPERRN